MLLETADRWRDNRDATGGGFKRSGAEGFIKRCANKDIGGPQQLRHTLMSDTSEEFDPGVDFMLPGKAAQSPYSRVGVKGVPCRTTRDEQFGVQRLSYLRDAIDDRVHPFARDEPSDGHHTKAPVTRKGVPLRREALQVHSHRNDRDFAPRNTVRRGEITDLLRSESDNGVGHLTNGAFGSNSLSLSLSWRFLEGPGWWAIRSSPKA